MPFLLALVSNNVEISALIQNRNKAKQTKSILISLLTTKERTTATKKGIVKIHVTNAYAVIKENNGIDKQFKKNKSMIKTSRALIK